jgi:hypothetical protein
MNLSKTQRLSITLQLMKFDCDVVNSFHIKSKSLGVRSRGLSSVYVYVYVHFVEFY